jgi:hypothetical protein
MPLPVDILFLRTDAPRLVIPNPRAPFKLDCCGVRDLLFGLQGIPAGHFNRARQLLLTHCIPNSRLFKRLRTLSCPERRNCARFKTPTLLFSASSALFRKNTRVGGYPCNSSLGTGATTLVPRIGRSPVRGFFVSSSTVNCELSTVDLCANSFRMGSYPISRCNPFRMRSSEKYRGEGGDVSQHSNLPTFKLCNRFLSYRPIAHTAARCNNGLGPRKQLRPWRCLTKESGHRVRQWLFAVPGLRSRLCRDRRFRPGRNRKSCLGPSF